VSDPVVYHFCLIITLIVVDNVVIVSIIIIVLIQFSRSCKAIVVLYSNSIPHALLIQIANFSIYRYTFRHVTHLNQSESSSNKIQNFGSCDLANKQHIPIKIQSLNLTVPRENPSEKPNGKPKLKIQMENPS
jgi:hypothetical protein